MMRVGDLLQRYRSGAFDAVWQEMRAAQSIGGDFRDEVRAVAAETMRRVARNADLLAERLHARGWRPLLGKLRTPPSPEDRAVLEKIATLTGAAVPPSLQEFWTIVGGIDFVWDYNSGAPVPDLGVALAMDEMDPLSVDPAGFAQHLFVTWERQRNEPDPDLVDPFQLDLAPDRFHKANTSGGAPYAVMLPFPGADPVLANERHRLPFVDYLRLSFRWAGFPGLEEHGERDDVQAFVRTFGAGLEPF
jgi:hypothetical protein